MKITGIILCIFFLSINGFAQNKPELSKKELKVIVKEEKKARQAEENELKSRLTKLMLTNKKFVLEADYLSGGNTRIPVSSNLNFIAVDSTEIVIQLGTISGSIGYNGVGGITVDGRITKYELDILEKKKTKNYSLTILVMSSLGNFYITFLINEIGRTNATIRSNRSGSLEYSGKIVPISQSDIYKGNSIF